jgi:hypothetical protein
VFLADDIILFPFKSLLSVFKEVYKAALEDMAGEADAIRADLAGLYQMLEQGVITEDDFDGREAALLDRLDAIEKHSEVVGIGGDPDDDGEPSEEDQDDEDDEDDGDDGEGEDDPDDETA